MPKYRKDGTLNAHYDPDVPHPGRVFYGGQWQTPDSIASRLEFTRKWKKENPEIEREYRKKNREKIRDNDRRRNGRIHLIGTPLQPPLSDAERRERKRESERAYREKNRKELRRRKNARYAELHPNKRISPCKRLGERDGIPFCVHGPMAIAGSQWNCRKRKLISSRNVLASGYKNEWLKVVGRTALAEGKCYHCRCRPVVTGFTECEVCRSKKRERGRLTKHFGMSVTIIRELGLDKNLPAPRRKNADR